MIYYIIDQVNAEILTSRETVKEAEQAMRAARHNAKPDAIQMVRMTREAEHYDDIDENGETWDADDLCWKAMQ